MIPMGSFTQGDECVFRFTYLGWRQRFELAEIPDVHRQFRVEAAKEGLSMAAVARRLVEEYLKRKSAGK
jgi:hypothetical protein